MEYENKYINYKDKYIKYKNKYLQLLAKLEVMETLRV